MSKTKTKEKKQRPLYIQSVDSLVLSGRCPQCHGELNIEWKCIECGFEAHGLVMDARTRLIK